MESMRRLALLSLLTAALGCGNKTAGGTDCPEGTVLDPDTSSCVECLPTLSHNCPTGQICGPDSACVPGCNAKSDCGDGQDCCGNQCVDVTSNPAACGACGTACGAGEGCCASACTPLDTLADCGACGNACTAGDFCDGTRCNTPTYPNFCANKTVYVIHDGNASDNAAGDLMASTISANCPPDVMVRTANQTDPTLVDQATGQPLGGSGVTYVLGGGPYPNLVLKYLERTQGITPIYFDAPDGVHYYWRERATGTAVASMLGSACSTHNDQFVTELVTDPASGTLSLIGYGACSGRGTAAAAWFYANVILPSRMSYPDSWYVHAWVDGDNDAMPGAADTFTPLAHGM